MWNRATNQIELTWFRHGKTPSNEKGGYLGRTEEDLSDEGKRELLELFQKGGYPPADIVISSPMRRCTQTAELLYPGQEFHVIESFREMDFGAFEGKNYEELKTDARYQAWIDSNGTLPFPGGESREAFIMRCREGLSEMLNLVKERYPYHTPHVSAIVHGGTIMALLSHYGGGDYFDYQCRNAQGYRCIVCFAKDQAGRLLRDSIRIEEVQSIQTGREGC